jgi:plasmid stability protein
MSKMLQVRHLPDALHRRLKMRATSQGKTLTAYVLDILKRADQEPTIDQWLADLRTQPTTTLKTAPADLIRNARQSR